MDRHNALQIIENAVFAQRGSHLSDLEKAAFQGAWENLTYQEMGQDERFPYSDRTLKDAGSRLFKLLSQAWGEKVSKPNFKSALERHGTLHTVNDRYYDWGDAIEVPVLFGREPELEQLEQWILHTAPSRLVALVGMGGMGKTALAVKLVEQVQLAFESFVWISLRDAPVLVEVVNQLIEFFQQEQATEAERQEELPRRVTQLFRHLTDCRCLVVFDNADTLLDSEQLAGQYRAGYENYADFFRRIANARHQSCVLLTGRELPAEIWAMADDPSPVRILQLTGLETAAVHQLFASQNLPLEQRSAEVQTLTEHYAGNPLALKIAAKTIRELFAADLAEFLAHDSIVFGDIQHLLSQQFHRLSALEQMIMNWLALGREPVSLRQIQENLRPGASMAQVIEAMRSLDQRYLIEKSGSNYTQQPVVMEYVTGRLIQQIVEELQTGQLRDFLRYPLVQAQAKDYIIVSQKRMILEPVGQQLRTYWCIQQTIVEHLNQILSRLRQEPALSGYGGGNLINLLVYFGIDLAGYDFSSLPIWQTDLRQVNLHRVNFAHADFRQSTFAEAINYLFSVAISPDGQYFATGEIDGTVRLWRTSNSQQLLSLKGHQGWVFSVAFSPDGQMLASDSFDQTMRLWNLQTGECRIVAEHTGSGHRLAFSPDGKTLASASADFTARLWDTQTGECRLTLQGHTHLVAATAFNPAGTVLATSSFDCSVRLWNPVSGEFLDILEGHTREVWGIAFSPDGQTLVSGSGDHTLKLWDMKTGKCKSTLLGHQHSVLSLTLSFTGALLASGDIDQTIRLWNLQTGECLRILHGNASAVYALAFTPDGQTLISAHENRTIHFWQVDSGRCVKTLEGKANTVWSMAFNHSSHLACADMGHSVKLWNVATGDCTLLQGHTDLLWAVAFSPDGYTLASASRDRTIRLWDTRTGECTRILQGHTGWVWAVDFSPDGQTLVSGSYDTTARIWDVGTGACLKTLEGHQSWIRAIAFSPDQQTIATGSQDTTVRLWNAATGDCKILQTGSHWCDSVAFHPQANRVAGSFDDGSVRLWDVNTGKLVTTIQAHSSLIYSIAFSPDGALLAVGTTSSGAKLLDVQTGECIRILPNSEGSSSVAFSPDGNLLAVGRNDEAIDIWNMETGNYLKTLRTARIYEGMNIANTTGLTEAQKATLKTLGAVAP